MKLMKSIYSMKQVSRVWNHTFDQTVKSWGFERLPSEWCVYRRHSPTGTIVFTIHVNDIISVSSSSDENEWSKLLLRQKWEISNLGPIKFTLGIAVSHNLGAGTISISQTALINRIVDQFNQGDMHASDIPMVPSLQL